MLKSIERLSDYGIVSSTAKTNLVFEKIEKRFSHNTDNPSVYVKTLWEKYKTLPSEYQSNAMNGSIFEAIITTAFVKEGITPLYTQTYLEFVPNVKYDLIVFPQKSDASVDASAPIVISMKTSLRERYKQADLEGCAMKNVYKRGYSYLITLDNEVEIRNANEKIKNKDILGLDNFINATTTDFDNLINSLKISKVAEPPAIKVVKKANTINI